MFVFKPRRTPNKEVWQIDLYIFDFIGEGLLGTSTGMVPEIRMDLRDVMTGNFLVQLAPTVMSLNKLNCYDISDNFFLYV